MKIIKFDPNLPTLQGDPKRQKKSARRERANRFRFRSLDGCDITPKAWLNMWAALYPTSKYGTEHDKLIAKPEPLSAAYFVRIGKWKDAAQAESKWKPNVAMVAYQIWMDAASKPPRCPDESQVADFLRDWSDRKYINDYGSCEREMHFGLSRATTLAYFISEGRFPIFDSRVRKAMMRLLGSPVPNSVPWYVDSFRPLFREIVALAAAENGRTVDKALFSYGGQIGQFED
ncbi:MAG: hypothetical protein WA183_06270 [Chthoniobacterales bacterium]